MAVNRIKHSSVAVFANDVQLDRVQTIGVSGRLDTEDLSEIGNLDIVEVVDNPPTVDVTLDTNQYGSNQTLGVLSNKAVVWGNSTVHVDPAVATGIKVTTGTVYYNEMAYTVPATTVNLATAAVGGPLDQADQITTPSYLDVETGLSATTSRILLCLFDTATDLVCFVQNPAATRTALDEDDVPNIPDGCVLLAEIQVDGSGADTMAPLTAFHIVNKKNPSTIHLKDFEFASVDFTLPVKYRGDNTDTTHPIEATCSVLDAFVNRYDASFSVNGLATENFSLETDNKTWFLNDASVLYVDRFQDATGLLDTFASSYDATQRDNGLYSVRGRIYDTATVEYTELTEVATFTSNDNEFRYNAGNWILDTALTATQTFIVRYPTAEVAAATTDQPFFKRVPTEVDPHPVIAGGLKHGQAEVYLSDDMNNFVLRLQSVSISASLSREALYEIGHLRAYDRPMTFPIPITVNVEATASDIQDFLRLCGKDFDTDIEAAITDFLKNLDLYVFIYRENDEVRAKAPWISKRPLKKICVKDLSITDENYEIRVGQNGTQTWGMKANTQLIISTDNEYVF